jgi:hypothetical protein
MRELTQDPSTGDPTAAAGGAVDVVSTTLAFPAPPEAVWHTLQFYEQVAERPPAYLRLVLPVPIRTEGRKSEVGDEALCLYEGGQLIKRVTRVEPGREYHFDVVQQSLRFGGGLTLLGGSYSLRPAGDVTELTAVTRYRSPRRPRWLWRPVEEAVCHVFHRHILRAMRAELKAGR